MANRTDGSSVPLCPRSPSLRTLFCTPAPLACASRATAPASGIKRLLWPYKSDIENQRKFCLHCAESIGAYAGLGTEVKASLNARLFLQFSLLLSILKEVRFPALQFQHREDRLSSLQFALLGILAMPKPQRGRTLKPDWAN